MKKRTMTPTIYTPTIVDREGNRHIIAELNTPALCGAVGEQYAPGEHRANVLCLRCRQKYAREIMGERLQEFGL